MKAEKTGQRGLGGAARRGAHGPKGVTTSWTTSLHVTPLPGKVSSRMRVQKGDGDKGARKGAGPCQGKERQQKGRTPKTAGWDRRQGRGSVPRSEPSQALSETVPQSRVSAAATRGAWRKRNLPCSSLQTSLNVQAARSAKLDGYPDSSASPAHGSPMHLTASLPPRGMMTVRIRGNSRTHEHPEFKTGWWC